MCQSHHALFGFGWAWSDGTVSKTCFFVCNREFRYASEEFFRWLRPIPEVNDITCLKRMTCCLWMSSFLKIRKNLPWLWMTKSRIYRKKISLFLQNIAESIRKRQKRLFPKSSPWKTPISGLVRNLICQRIWNRRWWRWSVRELKYWANDLTLISRTSVFLQCQCLKPKTSKSLNLFCLETDMVDPINRYCRFSVRISQAISSFLLRRTDCRECIGYRSSKRIRSISPVYSGMVIRISIPWGNSH